MVLTQCEFDELYTQVLDGIVCGFLGVGGGDDKNVIFESTQVMAWYCVAKAWGIATRGLCSLMGSMKECMCSPRVCLLLWKSSLWIYHIIMSCLMVWMLLEVVFLHVACVGFL